MAEQKHEEHGNNGSGDKVEDVSHLATTVVDGIVEEAEDKVNASADYENSEDQELEQEEVEVTKANLGFSGVTRISCPPVEDNDPVAETDIHSQKSEIDNDEEQQENDEIRENLVEASVEVHNTQEEAPKLQSEIADELSQNVEETTAASPTAISEKNVSFHETVSIIENDNDDNYETSSQPDIDQEDQVDLKGEKSEFKSTPSQHEFQVKNQDDTLESDNEDVDNIDIEKEFVMPSEAETNNNKGNGRISNGDGHILTRMQSNEIILGDDDKSVLHKENGDHDSRPSTGGSTGDEGLDSIMARKELVRQQVQMFEKHSPASSDSDSVKYSIRSASPKSRQEEFGEFKKTDGSNVKNLKNFFQQLSSTSETTPPSGKCSTVILISN